MIFLFVKKTLKQQKGEISILVDSTQKGYITLYLQIGTSGVRVTESQRGNQNPYIEEEQAT
jgi:hypothetical protein